MLVLLPFLDLVIRLVRYVDVLGLDVLITLVDFPGLGSSILFSKRLLKFLDP